MMMNMAERQSFDNEQHELVIGSSFTSNNHSHFHSMRYDFKPASVDPTKSSSVEIGEKNLVTVTVPHVSGAVSSSTVYRGNKRPCQKECVLVIDKKTGSFRLEKLDCALQLKKTRKEGSSKQTLSRPPTPSEQKKSRDKKNKVQPLQKPVENVKVNVESTRVEVPSHSNADPIGEISSSSDSSSSDSESETEEKSQIPAVQAQAPPKVESQSEYSWNISQDLQLSESGSDSDSD